MGAGVYVLSFSAAGDLYVLELPLEMYGHHLSVAYGQSVQRWGSWFGDQAKSFGLAWVVGGLLVMLMFRVIRSRRRGGGSGSGFRRWCAWCLGSLSTPSVIDPLFNKFEPLSQTNPALVDRLEQVVARGGIAIPPERMFLMKASAKSTGMNAYVTGIGASKRVVVWDTTRGEGDAGGDSVHLRA